MELFGINLLAPGGDAAELIAINQLLDRRMIAADLEEWFQGAAGQNETSSS